MKRALITGIGGQDGSYLAELLLGKGYEVYGMIRRSSTPQHVNIAHILDDIHLLHGDLLDQSSLIEVIEQSQPDEIYNLAAQSHVGESFHQPHATAQITGVGVLRLLEAIRIIGAYPRFYQASTSELFGNAPGPQNEDTPFVPRSPYGCAKLYAHSLVRNYREAYGMWACSGILFNHESPRRSLDFVTRKITHGLAAILAGDAREIELGNLDAQRDWGYAPDYVDAMWLMLQQEAPYDYVIATGQTHSIREFLATAGQLVGIDYERIVRQTTANMRPAEVHALCGDASRAKREMGWAPACSFEELVRVMMTEEIKHYGKQSSTQSKSKTFS